MPDTTTHRTLVLLRHAKAESHDLPDLGRRLADRGHADAAAVGRHLLEHGLGFDLVVCSPSTRTRETWADVAGAGVVADEVTTDRRVYEAGVGDLLDVLTELPDAVRRVAVVGHAPGVPALAEHLTDRDRSDADVVQRLWSGFPTSCLALLTYEGPWSELGAGSAVLFQVEAPRG